MSVIQGAIRYPVSTAVGVILVALFGGIALFRLPVQLTPDVEDPVVTVSTIWPGASPGEIEREIVQEQEEQLKSLEGLVDMESQSSDSSGSITLKFQVGTDLETALLRVSNRLEQVPEYPDDADKPVITTSDANSSAVAWFVLSPAGEEPFSGDIASLYDFVDDDIKPEFERVPGVSVSNFFGGRPHEMQVVVDPSALAARQLTLRQVALALEAENRNYSGGDFDEGKRRYIVRTMGEYTSPEDIEDIVIAVRGDTPVFLRDVGQVKLGLRKPGGRVFNKGVPIIAINASKEPGSNIFDVMDGLKAAADYLNRERLAEMGLALEQVYDETEYITSAIDLVQQSLVVGGLLAVVALLLYLRSASSTLVIAVAIPVSIVGSFLLMLVFGRTLNVISLAGMAFAVGMVVDNAIVVLENIYRHRQAGLARAEAALRGTQQVWGAVLASTLTTIAVFVPVIFMRDEVGQLFGDIALAISCAVGLSLVVSVTVIPSLSAKILGRSADSRAAHNELWGLARVGRAIAHGVADLVARIVASNPLRLAVVLGLTVASIGLSWLLMPQRDYLPLGNQNFVFGFMLPPPGYSLDETAAMEPVFSQRLNRLWANEAGSPAARALPGGGVRNYFFVALNAQAFMGAAANDPLRVAELIPEFRAAAAEIPGTIFVMSQRSLFERGRGEGRNIDIEIAGPELDRLIALGGEIFGKVLQELPTAQARPIPSLDLGNPEVRVNTDRRRAAELGISNRDLGFAVNALVDGAKATEYRYAGREIDVRLMTHEDLVQHTHLLEQLPIATPDGDLVTVGSLARVVVRNGPVQINRIERQRAITIQVTPDERTPLNTAMETVRSKILQPMAIDERLGGLYTVRLSGTAEKLSQTLQSIQWNLMLALVITYLLLAALFESFLYPLVILVSVPLAALGGVLGLVLVDAASPTGQKLDVLTMLGFIILIGTVVNNAILIVHQSLNHIREQGHAPNLAIREAVANRMRPIFMSVSTSVCGMLPLVLFPGAGSELYRGLGSVVVGGLLVSTVFTLFLVPALFSLGLDAKSAVTAVFLRRFDPEESPGPASPR